MIHSHSSQWSDDDATAALSIQDDLLDTRVLLKTEREREASLGLSPHCLGLILKVSVGRFGLIYY